MAMAVGLFGGTFDPIHLGHLIAAEEARIRLKLDRVIFIPAGAPWLKLTWDLSVAAHRLEMVRAAVADNPLFEVSTIEIDRAGPSFTVDTLDQLIDQHGLKGTIYVIVGEDAARDLPHWKDPVRLINRCNLAILPRLGGGRLDLTRLEEQLPGASARIVRISMPVIEISSTEIRRRVREGISVRYHVTEAVEKYIRQMHLYR